ncbi:hypothetical protein ABZ891_26475 [Streptomyces sp. NPDC047023]|uniref:hypothetical protein n=1 Tax=Streptomyces sp. NPDC047023 TaxID=3155139 RepID=UPI003408C729
MSGGRIERFITARGDDVAEQVLKSREACRSTGRPGKVITLLGSGASVALWWPRAAFSIDGGFEGHARDLGVVFVDLPLIVLGGVLIPLWAWTATKRRGCAIWAAALTAIGAYTLGAWGLMEWWTPRQHPDPGYGPGI